MPALVPAPSDLRLHSPALGPWFDPVGVELPAPADGELALTLTLGASGTSLWLPPARGTSSFYISTAARPAGIAGLRDPAGAPAFADDRLIAHFRLLPEVEERISTLSSGLIPTLADAVATGTGRRRPRVRSFALEFTQASPDWAFLEARLYQNFPWPPGVDTNEKKAEHLGLQISGGGLANGRRPMVDLIAPGKFAGSFAQLMRFTSSTEARFWIFDDRGHPIDPGAVATWWRYLTTENADVQGFTNLWAPGIDGDDRRIAPLASGATDRLTVHLVNGHGGPLEAEALARVTTTNADGTGPLRTRGTAGGALQLGFSAAPTPDDLPTPALGVLPDGRLGAAVNLWPNGAIDSNAASPILTRDFARVAVRSLEHDLVGQRRTAATDAAEPVRRRAADQNRDSTGLRVGRAARGGLQASIDVAAAAVLNVAAGAGTTRMVTGVLDRDYGPRTFTAPDIDPPSIEARPEIEVVALVGGSGTTIDSVVIGQRVLVTLTFASPAPVGAWVRTWTQGFDHQKAEHIRLEGGAGQVDADGRARLVALLPDGGSSPHALMGLEAMVVTARGARLYSDLRFDRPAPVAGSQVNLGSAAAGTSVLICDTGQVLTTPLANVVPSGGCLVANPTGTAALVDRTTIPAAALVNDTLINALGAGDVIALTEPAFKAQADGDSTTVLATSGATVTHDQRSSSPWASGNPLPGMERLETVAVNVDANQALAAIGSSPALARHHEQLAHRHGHPGCPACEDAHGTGVLLDGPAAIELAEYVRDRTAANTSALATAADTPLAVPNAPANDSLWAVGLRTEAAGVALEVGLGTLLASLTSGNYDFDASWSDKRTWLNNRIDPDIGGGVGAGASEASVVRAVDRRVLTSSFGAREAATSLAAAFARAEDFIYIETPALDGLAFGATDDTIDLWSILVDRMTSRPSLHVLLCLPHRLGRDTPGHLQRIRDAVVTEALAERAGHERFAMFQPAAGPQRALVLHSTSVIVDDAYALTGTTHLWRRGLSFDSSYAVALTDDRLENGRPQEIAQFRRTLIAGRLGLALTELPEDPADLVHGVRLLTARGGHGRLAAKRISPPDPNPELLGLVGSSSFTPIDVWNRDGSPQTGFNPVSWLSELAGPVVAGDFNP